MATPANPIPSTDLIDILGAKIDALGYRIDAIRRLLWTLLALLTSAVLGLLYMVITGS